MLHIRAPIRARAICHVQNVLFSQEELESLQQEIQARQLVVHPNILLIVAESYSRPGSEVLARFGVVGCSSVAGASSLLRCMKNAVECQGRIFLLLGLIPKTFDLLHQIRSLSNDAR